MKNDVVRLMSVSMFILHNDGPINETAIDIPNGIKSSV